MYLARVNRPDSYWSVNNLARHVTSWTVACDKRLHRLISYLRHKGDKVQTAWVGDPPEHCRLTLFSDASFADSLEDSKSTTGAYLVLVGPRTFVPITWICKKQGAVSHSSTESEVIALEASTRLEGIPLLILWEQVIDVFAPANSERNFASRKPPKGEILSSEKGVEDILSQVDVVPCTIPPHSGRAKLFLLEDNEAVIKMTVKGRSPNMRHITRTHRVDLDWLFERLRDDRQ